MMARQDRTDLKPATALSLLVAMLLTIIAIIAAVSWVVLCTRPGGAAICAGLAVPMLPVQGRIRTLHRRMQDWLLDLAMRETQRQIDQYFQLLQDDAGKLQALREQLSCQQKAQLQVRSQP